MTLRAAQQPENRGGGGRNGPLPLHALARHLRILPRGTTRVRSDGRSRHPTAFVTTIEIVEIGRGGVWGSGTWRVKEDSSVDVAAELEELGYTALWSSGGFDPGLATRFGRLLAATTHT